jgi:hypothetical protein
MPEFSIMEGNDLSLSGADLVELLLAVLGKGVTVRFRAKGFSMSSFMKDDDVVTLSSLSADYPSLGDVVAMTRPD